MSWQDLGTALALMLVLESLVPAIAPRRWQRTMGLLAQARPHQLRRIGMVGMVVGALLLQWIRRV